MGFITQGEPDILDQLSIELLDHQGVNYEVIEPLPGSSYRKYSVVVISKSSSRVDRLASEICYSKDCILSLDKIVKLQKVLQFLSGKDTTPEDRLDLIVNREELKLKDAIRRAFETQNLPFVFKWFWPDFRPSCCILTHDIDWLTYSPFHKAVFRGPLKASRSLEIITSRLIRGKDYGWNIPETLELEKKYGVQSTFFFLTKYDQKVMSIFQRSIELAKQANSEIALHGYHASHKSKKALDNELEMFSKNTGEKPFGLRYHILKFTVPQSWILESEADLEYDATFSYNEFYGFRSEICFPFHPFVDARLPIIEIPTSFMDWTALNRNTRGSKLRTKIKEIMDLVETFNGVLVVNFHNTYLNPETFADIYAAYETLLKSVSSKNYWICTARDCAKWWEYRSKTRLTPRVDSSGNITVTSDSRITLVRERGDSTLEPLRTARA